jgi:hypothetical protein
MLRMNFLMFNHFPDPECIALVGHVYRLVRKVKDRSAVRDDLNVDLAFNDAE